VLIDVKISEDRKATKKKAEKILEYKDLTIEIQYIRNVRINSIPLIIGEIRKISKSYRKYLSNIKCKHEIKELEKTVILGTEHMLRKVLMLKYKRFNMGNNLTYTINCNYILAATLYSLEKKCLPE
jgi:hypothetical protein